MIRIGICDDLVEQLQIQEEMVRNIVCRLGLNTEIKCFQSGEDLLWEMEQKGNMDIILLDIEMGGINGVETARRIREKDNRAILFFISYYEQYCKEIINVQPFRFIDKPVSEEELDRGFREAFKAMSQKEEIFEYNDCLQHLYYYFDLVPLYNISDYRLVNHELTIVLTKIH